MLKKNILKKNVIYSQCLSIQDVRKKDDMCSHLAKQGWYGRGCLKILDGFLQKPMNLMCDPTFGSTPVMTRTGHQPLGSEPSIATMTTRTIRRSQVRRCRQGSGRKAREIDEILDFLFDKGKFQQTNWCGKYLKIQIYLPICDIFFIYNLPYVSQQVQQVHRINFSSHRGAITKGEDLAKELRWLKNWWMENTVQT